MNSKLFLTSLLLSKSLIDLSHVYQESSIAPYGTTKASHIHQGCNHVQLVYMGTGDAAANGAVMTLLLVALTSLSPSSVS